ncbi:MAG: hypothetical protein ACTSSP_05210 [Candidatus Asgardarchaeia archaeon]
MKTWILVKFEIKEALSSIKFRLIDSLIAYSFLIFSTGIIHYTMANFIFQKEIIEDIILDFFKFSGDTRFLILLGITYLIFIAIFGSVIAGFINIPRNLRFLEPDNLVLRAAPIYAESIFIAKFIRFLLKRLFIALILILAIGVPFIQYWGLYNPEQIIFFSINIILLVLFISSMELIAFFLSRIAYFKFAKKLSKKTSAKEETVPKPTIASIFFSFLTLATIIVLLYPLASERAYYLSYYVTELFVPSLFLGIFPVEYLFLLFLMPMFFFIFEIVVILVFSRYYYRYVETFEEETELDWYNIAAGKLEILMKKFFQERTESIIAKDLILSLRTNLPRFFFFALMILVIVLFAQPTNIIILEEVAKDISITFGLIAVTIFIVAIMPMQLTLVENDKNMIWLIKILPFNYKLYFKSKHLFGFYLNLFVLSPIIVTLIILHPTLRTALAIVPLFLSLTYIYNSLSISDAVKFLPEEENQDYSVVAILILILRFLLYSTPIVILTIVATIFIPFQLISIIILLFYSVIVREISYDNAAKELINKELSC